MLDAVIAQLGSADSGEPLQLGDGGASGVACVVSVDHRVVPARMLATPAGTVWSVSVEEVSIVVVTAAAGNLPNPDLVRVADLSPYKRRRTPIVEAAHADRDTD